LNIVEKDPLDEYEEDKPIEFGYKKKRKRRRKTFSMIMFERRHIFTDKTHPLKGIMSFVLGLIASISLIFCIRGAFLNGGSAYAKYGAAALFAFIYSIIGLVLGFMARKQKDIFYLYPNLGIFICACNILFVIGSIAARFVF